MNRLIVISGNKNAGKTTALRYILEVLLYLGAKLLSYKSYNKVRIFRGDFEAIVEYNGKRIAICSMGDAPTAVPKHIKKYGGGSEIVITATRNDSDYTDRINQYAPIYIDKAINTNDSPEKQYMDLADFVRKVIAKI